jgi:hypothetical protein
MKNVYKVTYDLRIGRSRQFLAANNPNGWESRYVLANGDARAACNLVEREAKSYLYDGKKVSQVRIIRVEQVASNVLV